MQRKIPTLFALAALAVSGACARSTTVESTGEVVPATPVNANSLPTGSVVTVTLDQAVGTKQSKVGDTFSASVVDAIVASPLEQFLQIRDELSDPLPGLGHRLAIAAVGAQQVFGPDANPRPVLDRDPHHLRDDRHR